MCIAPDMTVFLWLIYGYMLDARVYSTHLVFVIRMAYRSQHSRSARTQPQSHTHEDGRISRGTASVFYNAYIGLNFTHILFSFFSVVQFQFQGDHGLLPSLSHTILHNFSVEEATPSEVRE